MEANIEARSWVEGMTNVFVMSKDSVDFKFHNWHLTSSDKSSADSYLLQYSTLPLGNIDIIAY